jgi:hypothetical protein
MTCAKTIFPLYIGPASDEKTGKSTEKIEVVAGQLLTLMLVLQWVRENFNYRDWKLVLCQA